MSEIIPGMDINPITSSITSGVGTTVNVIAAVVGVVFLAGVVFGVFFLIWKLLFEFNIPVTLREKVGNTVIKYDDMIKRKRKNKEGKILFGFKKRKDLAAEPPDDSFAVLFKKGNKIRKGFEGYVKNDNVAWIKPDVVEDQFVTIPTNLIRYHVDMSRRNAELSTKLKWYQNPVIMGFAMLGVWMISIIFIYIMHKSVVEEMARVIDIGTQVLKGAQIIK